MQQRAFRLTQSRYAETAYAGAGSLYRHGRWHRAGIPMVYTAESPALALLEIMVHIERVDLLQLDWTVVPCTFDINLMLAVEDWQGALPDQWYQFPWLPAVQELGQQWFTEQVSAILSVPSAVVPTARNYLLNPTHPQFDDVQIEPAQSFTLDPRLI